LAISSLSSSAVCRLQWSITSSALCALPDSSLLLLPISAAMEEVWAGVLAGVDCVVTGTDGAAACLLDERAVVVAVAPDAALLGCARVFSGDCAGCTRRAADSASADRALAG
jgi:hypothetical protein